MLRSGKHPLWNRFLKAAIPGHMLLEETYISPMENGGNDVGSLKYAMHIVS